MRSVLSCIRTWLVVLLSLYSYLFERGIGDSVAGDAEVRQVVIQIFEQCLELGQRVLVVRQLVRHLDAEALR